MRRFIWRWSLPCPAFRPHFFGACPKKRCRAAKEKRFFYLGGSTIRVSAAASVDGTFLARLGEGAGAGFWRIARLKVSSTFSKVAGCRGSAPARAPQSAELSFCSHKRRRGAKGEPSPGVPPLSLLFCVCAVLLGGVVALSCHSTPFLWCLPKETVSSRQRKALFYPGGSTIRVSAASR